MLKSKGGGAGAGAGTAGVFTRKRAPGWVPGDDHFELDGMVPLEQGDEGEDPRTFHVNISSRGSSKALKIRSMQLASM